MAIEFVLLIAVMVVVVMGAVRFIRSAGTESAAPERRKPDAEQGHHF